MLVIVTAPLLSSACSRSVAALPSRASSAQRDGWVSGASMPAIRTFSPPIRKVSPSTTQLLPPPPAGGGAPPPRECAPAGGGGIPEPGPRRGGRGAAHPPPPPLPRRILRIRSPRRHRLHRIPLDLRFGPDRIRPTRLVHSDGDAEARRGDQDDAGGGARRPRTPGRHIAVDRGPLVAAVRVPKPAPTNQPNPPPLPSRL